MDGLLIADSSRPVEASGLRLECAWRGFCGWCPASTSNRVESVSPRSRRVRFPSLAANPPQNAPRQGSGAGPGSPLKNPRRRQVLRISFALRREISGDSPSSRSRTPTRAPSGELSHGTVATRLKMQAKLADGRTANERRSIRLAESASQREARTCNRQGADARTETPAWRRWRRKAAAFAPPADNSMVKERA